MDSFEKFLQIKILGVDMIGILGISFIAALAFAFHKGDKRSGKAKWKLPIGCLALGMLGLLIALVMFDRETKGHEVLKTWTKTDGVVTRTERLESRGRRGRINYTNRATVAFVGPDGRQKEGLLFHEQHPQGNRITIFYDPQKDYSPGAPIYNGARELQTPHSIERETGSELRLIGILSLLAGGGSSAFGAYRLFHLIRNGTRARDAGQNPTKVVEV